MERMNQDEAAKQVPWNRVWQLYSENQPVFRSVFASVRAQGLHISDDDSLDLVHHFLVERAPFALATFNPEKGNIPSWLFVVFRRFVLGIYRSETQRRNLLDQLKRESQSKVTGPAPERELDLAAVQDAMSHVSEQEQQALRIFFDEGGSLRSVASHLGLSRWAANRLVVSAFAKIALRMEVDIGIDPRDLELLAETSWGDDSLKRVAGRSGVSVRDAQVVVRRVSVTLSHMISKRPGRER